MKKITLFCAVGLIIRLHLLAATNFTIDSDEAIVGLMAKHMLEGKGIPVFYYGQHYMGSLEAIMAAVSFKIFGATPFALKLVPLLWSLALIPLVYLLGKKVAGERYGEKVGSLAALLIALPPSALVEWSSRARGGFIEILVLGTLALIITIDWLKNEQSYFATTLIGLILGLGWWINNQMIFFILPIGLFMLLKVISLKKWFRDSLGHFSLGSVAFFIGGAPFWWYNIQNKFVSFEMFQTTKKTASNFAGLFEEALPIILGARRFWHKEDLFFAAPVVIFSVVSVLIFAALMKSRRDFSFLVLFVFLITTPVIFAVSSFGYLTEAPRYLLPLYPVLAVVLAVGISALNKIGFVFLAVVLFFNLGSSYIGGHAIPGEPFVYEGERVSRDQTELIDWLKDNKISWVRTNYWIGYRLAFETNEQVKFEIVGYPFRPRIDSYEEAALEVPISQKPYVLTPRQAEKVKEGLNAFGFSYQSRNLSGYVVLFDVTARQTDLIEIPHSALEVSATNKNEDAIKAIDNSLETRWGSGAPQSSSMEFKIRFLEPRLVRAIDYFLGKWETDYPRSIKISCELPEGGEMVLIDASSSDKISYFLELQGQGMMLYLPATKCSSVILRQLGKDPIFDWSIAELNIYE